LLANSDKEEKLTETNVENTNSNVNMNSTNNEVLRGEIVAHDENRISYTRKSFFWTGMSLRAAELYAEGGYKVNSIANIVGCSVSQLKNWLIHPDFIAKVDEYLEQFNARVIRNGIAVRQHRIDKINDRYQKIERIIRERSSQVDPESEFYDQNLETVPGVSTGYVTTEEVIIGSGPNARFTIKSKVDTELLRTQKDLEEHMAKELGQWTEKREIAFTQKMYAGIDLDEI
jgi:hypothetical protein